MKKTKLYYGHTGWLRVLGIVIPYIFIVGAFQLIAMALLGLNNDNYEALRTSQQEFVISFTDLLGTFLVLWLFVSAIQKEKFINLGFQVKNRLIEFNFGIGLGIVIMFLGFLILILISQIFFEKLNFNVYELLLSIGIFIIVAVVEETLIRGYVLKNLMLSFNKYIALLISSLLFSVMHAANPNFDLFAFLDLFLAGILLGLSYVYTKNLWFPIALHFSWNFFQSFFGFNVSGQDLYSVIEISIRDNNLLNGGGFGFEGSVLSIIFQLISIFFIYKYFNKRGSTLNLEK